MPGEITCDIDTNVPAVSKGSGRTTKKALFMPRSATMDIKYWQAGKKGGDSVSSVTGGLWAITSILTVKAP